MWKSARSKAEQQFTASRKKDQETLKQKQQIERERDEKTARLKELRLAKEAADRQADEDTTSKPDEANGASTKA